MPFSGISIWYFTFFSFSFFLFLFIRVSTKNRTLSVFAAALYTKYIDFFTFSFLNVPYLPSYKVRANCGGGRVTLIYCIYTIGRRKNFFLAGELTCRVKNSWKRIRGQKSKCIIEFWFSSLSPSFSLAYEDHCTVSIKMEKISTTLDQDRRIWSHSNL